jgi:hypothetical protein
MSARGTVVAGRRGAGLGAGAPATAPKDPVRAASFPCAAVSRCAVIAVVPGILHPFPDVAVHVIQAPRIRLLLTDRMCLQVRIFCIPCILAKFRVRIAK